MFVYIILVTLPLIFVSTPLFAWGPGTHLEIALGVLGNLALISPSISLLIRNHRKAFLYGAISADVVVGKKYAGHRYHCHTWRVGRELLKSSHTPVQKAAAYGYLVHLAADVVAHNYYVPYKIIRSFNSRFLTHTYWEMRFDLHVGPSVWRNMEEVLKGDFEDFDKLLERSFRNTLFSFPTNRRIFRSILILQKGRRMHRALRAYAKRSQWLLEQGDIKHYRRLVSEAVFDFLQNGLRAECVRGDPSGWSRIEYAGEVRRKFKSLKRRGVIRLQELPPFLRLVKKRLKEVMYHPKAILPDFYFS